MKKLILCVSLICMGLFVSCIDKNEEVDEDSKPSWLGNSIYEELKTPNQEILTGTFTNYLRLVDDLDYATVLSKTGSKTVFPANDEAFERFFKSNSWGVTRYEELSEAQKKLLLYSSMLDNSMLISMLSNVSSGSTEVMKGKALKHPTALSVIDSIPFYLLPTNTFMNNSYFTRFDSKGLYAICDNTQPMMVHFTRDQLLENDITTTGSTSDFQILTGSAYEEGSAYIFRDKVIKSDVTCQNGYIQQVQDVLAPSGNLSQIIRQGSDTKLFSRMLDRFAVPFYDPTTTNSYNDWAVQRGKTLHDSIFQVRYLSSISQDQKAQNVDNVGKTISSELLLPFDPSWNQYYVANKQQTNVDWTLADMGAMFVPTDDAVKSYFLPGGSGAFLIEQYGVKSNTASNLEENIDAIPQNIIQKFVANLMKTSFIATVPSKFASITNDVSDDMGMSVSLLQQKSDGTYDVRIANNGVVYILNSVIAPTEYVAVSAPAYFNDGFKVINWVIQNKAMTGTTVNPYSIDLDFYAYLKAMSANFAIFLPSDEAFNHFYVDPVTLGHTQPTALHFFYNSLSDSKLSCSRWSYDPKTNTVGDSLQMITNITSVAKQLCDIMNYHTVVLASGEKLGKNKYYKTKQGGEICVSGGSEGSTIVSGGQINNGLQKGTIQTIYNEKNGTSYKIDRLIQGPQQSVYKALGNDERFEDFLSLCNGFDQEDLLNWAGISNVKDATTKVAPQDAYKVFVAKNGLDYNVKFFNTFNYTLYAPDNQAMVEAYNHGLPRWTEIYKLYQENVDYGGTTEANAKAKAYAMINAIKQFVRYHFQTTSVYADNVVEGGQYQTLCSDDLGLFSSLILSGGNGKLIVVDESGTTHTINSSSTDEVSNIMTRDFEFDKEAKSATSLTTSSFAVIHELTTPLYNTSTKRYDGAWSSAKAMAKSVQKYLRLKASNNL